MEVVRESSIADKVCVSDINAGQCFVLKDKLYLRIKTSSGVQAVDLATGLVDRFVDYDGVFVTPAKAKVIFTEKNKK